MRKTIVFGAIAALFGLASVAQAANDQAKPFAKHDAQITQKADMDGRGEKAEIKKQDEKSARERTHSREHTKEARERGHHKEARERGHKSGAYVDRD